MALQEVSGWTPETIAEKREDWSGDIPFEERYCLAKIPHQPDSYQGPDRYCGKMDVRQGYRCKFHGGASEYVIKDKDRKKVPAIKHGMYATDEHLKENFTEKDQALYDWVMETYPAAYDIDISDDVDPSSRYDIHTLAIEMVRAERGEAHVLKEGEKYEKERYTEGGEIIISDGEIVTEESEHYLASMMNRQRNLVMKIKDHLGISRKQRLDRDEATDAKETMQGLAGTLGELIGGSDREYDPEEFGNGDD